MKRICAVFAVLFLIFTAGCQKSEEPVKEKAAAPSAYSSKLEATFKETKMTAKLIKHSDQKYEIQMLSPEIMKPLNLVYENKTCTVTYDGLTFETDLKRFPQTEFGALLVQALTDISTDIVTVSTDSDGMVKYTGPSNYGDFALTQDPETGLWKEFSIDGASLTINFTDYITN